MGPSHFQYTKEHEWIHQAGELAVVGVTHYALEQLGDVVHIDLPEVGSQVVAGEPFGTIESTKTVSDLYAPVSGTVAEVNGELVKSPESIQDSPYDNGWLIKIRNAKSDKITLMSKGDYERYLEEH